MLIRPQYARREQRKYQRYALHPPSAFRIGEGPFIEAFCRDLSLGGAFFETSTLPLFASEVDVRLDLPGFHDLRIRGTVRWTNREGIGVQFGALSARETHALVSYFHSEKAPPLE